MTTPYHALATAKAELREAKDHEQTVRAITEAQNPTMGRNADDRKRELSLALSQSGMYAQALRQLREAEYTVDRAQADVDQAETERRDQEWRIRARLAEALQGKTQEHDDFDGPTIDQITKAIQDIALSRGTYAGVAREMLDAYNTGMADRVNGAGEFEPDDDLPDPDPEADYQAERYSSSYNATRRRIQAQREIDEVFGR